jgi:hypothetical protein
MTAPKTVAAKIPATKTRRGTLGVAVFSAGPSQSAAQRGHGGGAVAAWAGHR